MHCNYCGHALPDKGIICPNCGKTISKEQLAWQKDNKLDNWDYISNKNTGFYKKEKASEVSIRKGILLIICALAIVLLIAFLKIML